MADSRKDDWTYFRRLLITLAVVGVAYAVWQLSGILMLAFAAILLAVLLAGLADVLSRHTRLPWPWALTVGTVTVLVLVMGALALFGAQLSGQLDQLVSRIPRALDEVGRRLGIVDLSQQVLASFEAGSGSQFLSHAARFGYTFIGIVADIVLVVVAAIYLAADRSLHQSALKLLAPSQQERAQSVMSASARALRLWFMGQMVSMALVGTLSGLAFWAIGLPLPIGLGFVAGVSNFIPLVGPILGAVPAVVLALAEDWTAVLWTIAAIVVIQHVEGYVLMPLVQRRAVDVSPALVLFAIAAFGVLFGWLGVALAVPLTVVLMVIIQKIWVREILGEPATVPGEKK
jgi:predicted PurR-regulated permease PerM